MTENNPDSTTPPSASPDRAPTEPAASSPASKAKAPRAPKSAPAKPAVAKPAAEQAVAADVPPKAPVTKKPAAAKASAPKTSAPKANASPAKPEAPAPAKAASATAKSAAAKTSSTKPAAPEVASPTPAKATETAVKKKPPVPKTDAIKAPPVPPPVVNQPPVKSAPLASEAIEDAVPPLLLPKAPPVKRKQARPGVFMSYIQLMRLNKPIGILLLLWPTLWALWLAAKGVPRWDLIAIFTAGVVIMRTAGCVINDFADRKIDGKVQRTQDRPLATGAIKASSALILFVALCIAAFGLVLMTDPLTIKLSVGGLVLAASYPFMKRYTHLPQVVLGAAFAWGIPMAFSAQAGEINRNQWLIYIAVVLWTIAYDTFYAMVDRDDDRKIGVKSTAILFGDQDRIITGLLQAMTILTLIMVGKGFELGLYYYLGLVGASALFIYQQWLIRFRERSACFTAFLNNNWVGLVVFIGIVSDFALK